MLLELHRQLERRDKDQGKSRLVPPASTRDTEEVSRRQGTSDDPGVLQVSLIAAETSLRIHVSLWRPL